jgi:NitT/TauT family transport system substrate-binding protein
MRSFGTSVAIILALAFAPSASAQLERTSLALPTNTFTFAAQYIAQDAGIYQANGLEVAEQLVRGVGAANAVISGSIDFSFSSGPTVTRAAARGQPLIAIATTIDRSTFRIVVSKKIAEERHFDAHAPLAERARIMKGLRFAVADINAIPHAVLKVIAKAGGLDAERDLVVTGMAPQDQIPALERGAIDGFAASSPQPQEALAEGVGVIIADTLTPPTDPPWLAHVAGNLVTVRPQTCAARREICEKMGHAMLQANAFLHDRPQEAMAILGKRLNVTDPKVLAAAYKDTVAASPVPPLSDAQALATADDLNVEAGFMSASEKLANYGGLFTNEYVK